MSQDEVRKLLGGYATGTLTDAERQALFAAALDDQELFDELGREQALKELLEMPGARTRLAAALTPPRTVWWRTPLPWALAGTLAVALLVIIVMRRTPPPTEIAAVKVAAPVEERAAQPAQGETAKEQQPKALRSEPSTPPAELRKQTFQQQETIRRDADSNRAAPPPPGLQPALPPQQALKKEESAKTDSLGPSLADKAVADEKDVRPPVTQAAQSQVPSGIGREQQLAAANSAAPTPTAALRSAPPASAGGLLARPRFAFDYTIRRDSLTVRPLAAGFLQVTAQTSTGQQLVLQSASRLESGTSVSIAIPTGSATLTVEFSANAAARNLVKSLASRDAVTEQKARASAKASISKEKTGHVEEPLPAADPSVSIVLAVPIE